jgi:hypothetical protein
MARSPRRCRALADLGPTRGLWRETRTHEVPLLGRCARCVEPVSAGAGLRPPNRDGERANSTASTGARRRSASSVSGFTAPYCDALQTDTLIPKQRSARDRTCAGAVLRTAATAGNLNISGYLRSADARRVPVAIARVPVSGSYNYESAHSAYFTEREQRVVLRQG